MASLEEIRRERVRKDEALRSAGIHPYPVRALRTHTLLEAGALFKKIGKKKVCLAGRVMAIRGQGGLSFFDIFDGTGSFQGALKQGETEKESLDNFLKFTDIGDFIEAEGSLFLTKKGQKTILVKNFRMLAKSLRPLPDKWHGLENTEERFRRRYLDLISSPEVRERFIARAKIIASIRKNLEKSGFLEVETPMLQTLPGGAVAVPFKTHHNALDMDLYLRIAPELYLKELLVGGFTKVYELNRNFRNEGIDVTHNPEFTMLEFYEAYSDADKIRAFVEKLVRSVGKEMHRSGKFEFDGAVIDISKKFSVVSYFELLKRHALIPHPERLNKDEYALHAKRLGIDISPNEATEKIMDAIYKKTCRPKLIQPTFIVDYPVHASPFAKKKEGSETIIDRFQLVIGGLEIVNAFSELNDPLDQRARYEEQERRKKAGDKEISPSDENYLEAMEYGMPPAAGVGIGIDRLTMLLTNVKNIREVILFPTLRPKT